MKLGNVAAAAVLLAPLSLMSTDPAAAAGLHTVTVSGVLTAVDGGGFGQSQKKRTRDISGTFRLSHTSPGTSRAFSVCAGGETRGEVRIQLRLTRSEAVVATTRLRLYEESDCDNEDLEETKTSSTALAPGATRNVQFGAYTHEAGSYDFAFVKFTVTHDAAAPAAPSNLTATRLQGRKVDVRWVDNATDETGYEIRNTAISSNAKPLPANTTNYIYHFNQVGPAYACFQVRAVGPGGTSDWTPTDPFAVCP
ncbi:hypothetical protein [Streptomyces sp. NPDC088762]|uniref:hypothetical protein n=1 Tax=Streptomyces sp. NPDC088762 TaxID=3365891 RepID=UPI00382754D1